MPEVVFKEPSSIFECRERIRTLTIDARKIEAQLSLPYNVDPKTGKRRTRKQYQAWRKNALTAYRAKHEEIGYLNEWLRHYLKDLDSRKASVDPGDPESLLRGAYRVFEALKDRDGIGIFEPEELAVTDAVRDYVKGMVAKKPSPRAEIANMPVPPSQPPPRKHKRPRIRRNQ